MDDTRDVNPSLGVCPTCAWPMVTDGECARCRPLALVGASTNAATAAAESVVARAVSGQMPGMAVFSETQQASSVERQRQLAWRDAELTFAQRRSKPASRRLSTVFIALVVVAGAIGAVLVLGHHRREQVSLSTPSDALPWRRVAFDPLSTVELPGAPVASSATSEIGDGSRIATTIPGATIAVGTYRTDFGMRGSGAVAFDLLTAKAADLGDANAASRILHNRDRWGVAYDLTVMADGPAARLRAIVVGPTLYLIEVVGPQTPRTNAIFSHVVNSLIPKNSES